MEFLHLESIAMAVPDNIRCATLNNIDVETLFIGNTSDGSYLLNLVLSRGFGTQKVVITCQ